MAQQKGTLTAPAEDLNLVPNSRGSDTIPWLPQATYNTGAPHIHAGRKNKKQNWSRNVAKLEMAFAAKLDDQSSIPKNHMGEETCPHFLKHTHK